MQPRIPLVLAPTSTTQQPIRITDELSAALNAPPLRGSHPPAQLVLRMVPPPPSAPLYAARLPGPGIKEESLDASATLLPLQRAAHLHREALKNKAYRAFPLGGEAAAYLRQNRGRLLPSTYTAYESCLDKFARFFCDLELEDFEPPIGTERLEEFIDEEYEYEGVYLEHVR